MVDMGGGCVDGLEKQDHKAGIVIDEAESW